VSITRLSGGYIRTGSIPVSAISGSLGGLSGGTANYVPVWTSPTAQSSSNIFQSGSNVGIGTPTPATLLDVNGATTLRGHLTFVTDASFDIGASSTTRPRNIYASGDAIIAGVRIGRGAGAISTNTAVGNAALIANTTGFQNTAIGNNALVANTTGSQNTAIGHLALTSNTGGGANTAIGVNALLANTGGGANTAIGVQALENNTTGNNNIAIGVNSLYSNTTGYTNTAIGVNALAANTTGQTNTAIGYSALHANSEGIENTACGQQALTSNTVGNRNTGTGNFALFSNTDGVSNSAYGVYALYQNFTGNNNTGIGVGALYANTTGANNTALGLDAGRGDESEANTTGDNNTFVGFQAMGASSASSNTITLGNGSIDTLRCQATSITSLSDARDKKDIVAIPAGLAFINALNPVSFVWNTRDGKKVGIPEFGFIAQELQAAQTAQGVTVPNLVSTVNPQKLEASAGTLIPILVKAIHELTARIEVLEQYKKCNCVDIN